MEKINKKFEIRDLRDGDWYWIHKAIIQEYAARIRAISVVVYNFLASMADTNQSCFPSQKYIAKRLGYSRTTINRTIKRLEEIGLIKIEKRDRYHCIYSLLKVRCKASKTQMSSRRNSDVYPMNTNNNKLTRINNNIDIDNKKFLDSNFNAFKGFKPKTKEELLALDIAEALNDRKSIALYLSYSRKYPESLLRKVLGEVREIPDRKIKKSRAALFNHLIQKYAEKTS